MQGFAELKKNEPMQEKSASSEVSTPKTGVRCRSKNRYFVVLLLFQRVGEDKQYIYKIRDARRHT